MEFGAAAPELAQGGGPAGAGEEVDEGEEAQAEGEAVEGLQAGGHLDGAGPATGVTVVGGRGP